MKESIIIKQRKGKVCDRCGGDGVEEITVYHNRLEKQECTKCSGTGWIIETEEREVKVKRVLGGLLWII
jgi:DnaJ-class molecular chaperone